MSDAQRYEAKAREWLREQRWIHCPDDPKACEGKECCCEDEIASLATLLAEVAAELKSSLDNECRGTKLLRERMDRMTHHAREISVIAGGGRDDLSIDPPVGLVPFGESTPPREATPAMIDAGVAYRLGTSVSGGNNWRKDTAHLWRVMVAAAQPASARIANVETEGRGE